MRKAAPQPARAHSLSLSLGECLKWNSTDSALCELRLPPGMTTADFPPAPLDAGPCIQWLLGVCISYAPLAPPPLPPIPPLPPTADQNVPEYHWIQANYEGTPIQAGSLTANVSSPQGCAQICNIVGSCVGFVLYPIPLASWTSGCFLHSSFTQPTNCLTFPCYSYYKADSGLQLDSSTASQPPPDISALFLFDNAPPAAPPPAAAPALAPASAVSMPTAAPPLPPPPTPAVASPPLAIVSAVLAVLRRPPPHPHPPPPVVAAAPAPAPTPAPAPAPAPQPRKAAAGQRVAAIREPAPLLRQPARRSPPWHETLPAPAPAPAPQPAPARYKRGAPRRAAPVRATDGAGRAAPVAMRKPAPAAGRVAAQSAGSGERAAYDTAAPRAYQEAAPRAVGRK